MIDVESSRTKGPHHLLCREQPELVDFADTANHPMVVDLVLEQQSRQRAVDLRARVPRYCDTLRLTAVGELPVRLEYSRREPWLDERHAARCEMVAETRQGARHPLQRAQIAQSS